MRQPCRIAADRYLFFKHPSYYSARSCSGDCSADISARCHIGGDKRARAYCRARGYRGERSVSASRRAA